MSDGSQTCIDDNLLSLSLSFSRLHPAAISRHPLSTPLCPHPHPTPCTSDGEMGDVCGQSLPHRQHDGMDIGTTVREYPTDEVVISWARELLDLPDSETRVMIE